MLRLLRAHVGHRPSFRAFTTAFLLLGMASSAWATIDAQLNTTGFTPGQASDLCVDGLIYSGGTSTSLNGALLTLRFDPAKVALSGVRAATGWTLQGSNLDHASEGWAKIILTNSSGTNGAGQTLNGPIVYFTVTPANNQVDVDDCQTLRLDGTDSNLSDQDYETTVPSDPCAGRNMPIGPETTGGDTAAGNDSVDSTALDLGACPLPVADAAQILRLAGGLSASFPMDLDAYDRDADEKITFADAAILLRTPCPLIPKGWYTFQGHNRRHGRTYSTIRRNLVSQWAPLSLPTETGPVQEQILMPSVVAVPGTNPNYPVLYAVVSDGTNSRLYRITDNGSSTTAIDYRFPIPNTNPAEYHLFEATGTPMVLLRSGEPGQETIIVTGNRYGEAHVFRIDAETVGGQTSFREVWHRHWEGSIYAAPAFYAGPLEYTPDDGVSLLSTSPPSVVIPDGQAVILAANQTMAGAWPGYLIALDLNNGNRVWGRVDSNGEPTPTYIQSLNRVTPGGLYPFTNLVADFEATYSSPAIKGQAGYANDSSCYVNARNMRTGARLWEKAYNMDTRVDSTTVLFEDKLFYGQNADDGDESLVALQENAARTDATPWWEVTDANLGLDLGFVYGTPALHAETRSLVFGDRHGHIHGVGTEKDVNQPDRPAPSWLQSYQIPPDEFPVPVLCSPLISGTPGGEDTVFIGADDARVYVFDASSGGLQPSGDPLNVLGPLNGKIRSSMAAYNGRLYVLTMGDPLGSPATPPALYCFQ